MLVSLRNYRDILYKKSTVQNDTYFNLNSSHDSHGAYTIIVCRK